MLGIGRPDRHALPRITPIKCADRKLRFPPARAGSFLDAKRSSSERIVGSPPRPSENRIQHRRAIKS